MLIAWSVPISDKGIEVSVIAIESVSTPYPQTFFGIFYHRGEQGRAQKMGSSHASFILGLVVALQLVTIVAHKSVRIGRPKVPVAIDEYVVGEEWPYVGMQVLKPELRVEGKK